jgi:outer membrane cobalamin receptor
MLACLLVLAPGLLPADEYDGRTLIEVLRELQAAGLQIIFSSDLVQPEMLVESEPEPGSPRAVLEQILAPHGLRTITGPNQTILVVRVPAPKTGAIAGSVYSQSSSRPIPAAVVRAVEAAIEVTTAADGSFRIDGLAAGTHTLEVRAAGYHTRLGPGVTVSAGKSVTVSFELAPLATFLKEIVVIPSYLGILRDEPATRQFLSRTEVNHTPHLADDLYRAIGRLPGMARNDFSAKMSVRGGASNEVLVLLDGLEVHEPYHFRDMLALFSIIDSEAIAGVDILSGGFTAEYGNRMSGVFEVSSAAPAAETETALGMSFLTARMFSGGSFDDERGQWMVSLRRGFLDVILAWTTTLTDDDDDDEELDPKFWDMLGKVQYQLSERTSLSGNVLVAADRAIFRDYDDDPESLEGDYRSTYLWSNLKTAWRPGLFSQTVLSLGEITSNRQGFIAEADTISDDRRYRFVGLSQHWSWQVEDRHYLKWGLDARYESASYDYHASGAEVSRMLPPGNFPRKITTRLSGTSFGVFLSERFKLTEPLVAELGLRWDHQSEPGESQLSPRCNLVYSRGRSALRAAWGKFYQPHRLNELQVEDGATRLYPAQVAEHRLLGFEHELGNGLLLRAEVYQKKISDPHPRFENIFERTSIHPELRYDRVLFAPTRAETRGIELLVKRDGDANPRWWASYALAWAEDEIDGYQVPRSWDQRHSFRFSLTWLLQRGWSATIAGMYHSGWPTTDASAELRYDPDDSYWYIDPELGPINGERMGGYRRLDVRFGRQIQYERSSFSFFIEIINLLNSHNYTNMDGFWYDFQKGSSVETYAEWDTWFPLTPSFGLTWRF